MAFICPCGPTDALHSALETVSAGHWSVIGQLDTGWPPWVRPRCMISAAEASSVVAVDPHGTVDSGAWQIQCVSWSVMPAW